MSDTTEDEPIAAAVPTTYFCYNCKRKGTELRNENVTRTTTWFQARVKLISTEVNQIRFKVKPCLITNSYNDPSHKIHLCWQCHKALTLRTSDKDNPDYCWPAFMWSLIKDNNIRAMLKTQLWALFPLAWRPWWIDKVSLYQEFRTVSLQHPDPHIMDMTMELQYVTRVMKELKIREMTKVLDERCFYPDIKCPWGCSIFIIEAKGDVPFDKVIMQLIQNRCGFKDSIMLSPSEQGRCVHGMRKDFLTEQHVTLGNKKWRVMPSIHFIPGKGPRFASCGFHSVGTTSRYIHPPTNPLGAISSDSSDQFSQAVICPRTIKFAQHKQFSNSFHMSKIHGKYDGVDSATLTNHGCFDKANFVSMSHDALVLAGRPDVSHHLSQLVTDRIISSEFRTAKLNMSEMKYQNVLLPETYENNLSSSTFITLKDAIDMENFWKNERPFLLKVMHDTTVRKTIYFSPSWPSKIINIHPHLCKHGSMFPLIPFEKDNKIPGAKLVWGVYVCLLHAPTVWSEVCCSVTNTEQWFGWFLHTATTKFIKEYKSKASRNSPFRKSLGMALLVEKLSRHVPLISTHYNPKFFADIFGNLTSLTCIPFHDLNQWDVISNDPKCETVLIYKDLNVGNVQTMTPLDRLQPPNQQAQNGNPWIAVCITETLMVTNDRWKGRIFSRHGGTMHTGWWLQEKQGRRLCRTKLSALPQVPAWDFVIYVRQKQSVEDLRKIYIELIGGQVKCKCSVHLCYLVRLANNIEKSCSRVGCDNAAIYACCEHNCTAALCATHVDSLQAPGAHFVTPITTVVNNVDYDNAVDTASSEDDSDYVETTSESSAETFAQNMDNEEDDFELFDPDDHDSDELHNLSTDVDSFIYTSGLSSNESDTTFSRAPITRKRKVSPSESLLKDNVTYGVMETDHLHEPEEPFQDIEAGFISTNRGRNAISISTPESMIGLHVIFNKYQRLLTRYNGKLSATRTERNFVERIVSTSSTHSVPLVYPEGVLFPSLFWHMCPDGSIPGAIPGALMTSNQKLKKHGFATLYDHMRTRVLNTQLISSTDYRYQFYAMDACINLGIRGHDTRVILSRGFGEKMNHSGILMNYDQEDNPMLNCDFIDSRPIVNKLAAAMGERMPTFFYTHTCSQKTHIGMRVFKKWIDSDESVENTLKMFGKDFGTSSLHDIAEAKRLLAQCSCLIAVRSWNLIFDIWMRYITQSKEYPIGKIDKVFNRKELQGEEGAPANLHHGHSILWHADDDGSPKSKEKILTHIRATIDSLVLEDEFSSYVESGIISSKTHLLHILEELAKFLPHNHNRRCLVPKRNLQNGIRIRSRDIDSTQVELLERYKCKVPDNYLLSQNPTRHTFIYLDITHTDTAIKILEELDLVCKQAGSLKLCDLEQHEDLLYLDRRLEAKRHIPPTNANEGVISPVLARLVIMNPNSDNVQHTDSYGVSKYLAKYVTGVDQGSRIYLKAPKHDTPNAIHLHSESIGNTKITSIAMQERKKQPPHISSRAISQPEAIMLLCQIPQISTNIEFIHVSTVSLEERPGMDKKPTIYKITKESPIHGPINTGADLDTSQVLPSQNVRTTFPQYRQFTNSSIMLAKDQLLSPLTIDSITIFGLRPPELYWVRQPRLYFRWFKCFPLVFGDKDDKKNIQAAIHRYCSVHIKRKVEESLWIDARSYRVFVRYYAVPEIMPYLCETPVDWFGNSLQHKNRIVALFTKIHKFINDEISGTGIRQSHVDIWKDLKERFVCCDAKYYKHLPTIWVSTVKPTSPNRFLIHLLFSFGQYINEMDLFEAGSIKQAFIVAKLLDPANVTGSINMIMNQYVISQLSHIPGGTRQFDRFLACAYECLTASFLHDTMFADGTPPYLYTRLTRCIEEKQRDIMNNMFERVAIVTFNHLDAAGFQFLPRPPVVYRCVRSQSYSVTPWTALTTPKHTSQSYDSYSEQRDAISRGQHVINQYMTLHSQCPKSIVLVGDPGAGKTTIAQCLLYHAMTRGLKCAITAMMSERATELGGLHLHSLLNIPVREGWSPSRLAEYAISRMLQRSSSFLEFVRQLDVLMLDELGQTPSEILSTIDIIFRTIRRCSRFMGGILLITTMDILQLLPVEGRPPMLSSHMLTSFQFYRLQESVRSGRDPNFCEIQKITRLLPAELTSVVCQRFRQLIKNTCTFLPSFDSPAIPPNATYIFGRKLPGREIQEKIITNKRRTEDHRVSISFDEEMLYEGSWQEASSYTTALLENKVKEPHQLVLFKKALYLVTFNSPHKKFSQAQLAILMELPPQENIERGKPIEVYVSPPGRKDCPPPDVTVAQLLAKEWTLVKVGLAPRTVVKLRTKIRARRKQYGLSIFLTSTIHSSMGHTLSSLVTRISMNDANYNLWERAQVVVLLSRTELGQNTIFIGDPDEVVDTLLHALRQITQYQQYMQSLLLNLITPRTIPHVTTINQAELPFRPVDILLPDDNSGVVYMIASASVPNISYIGQCRNLSRRIDEHNSKTGSNQTASHIYKPWYLLAYVVGFGSDTAKLKAFESQWKLARERERHRLTQTGIAELAKMVITDRLSDDPNETLRYITGIVNH